ncbi:MAG: SCO family protein [Bacteroidota bacterium]|nr:SCO family protein [Bacteroidota bacterium]
MNRSILKWVVLLGIMVLPIFVYLVFVYSAEENFFVTLEYVGPREPFKVERDGEVSWDTTYYTLPDFEFTDQDGNRVTREDMKGEIYVASFFFTYCPSICPAMNFHLREVASRFKGYQHFHVLSHTVDPIHDTVTVLKAYQKKMEAEELPWTFLTGDKESLYSMAREYFLNAQVDSTAEGGYLHSESVVLVDWNGHIRSRRDESGNIVGAYNVLKPTELGDLKDDIKVLIAEYEKTKSKEEYEREKAERKKRK